MAFFNLRMSPDSIFRRLTAIKRLIETSGSRYERAAMASGCSTPPGSRDQKWTCDEISLSFLPHNKLQISSVRRQQCRQEMEEEMNNSMRKHIAIISMATTLGLKTASRYSHASITSFHLHIESIHSITVDCFVHGRRGLLSSTFNSVESLTGRNAGKKSKRHHDKHIPAAADLADNATIGADNLKCQYTHQKISHCGRR